MVINPEGNATAVWERFDGSKWIIQSAERPAGGAWSKPVNLSASGQDAHFAQVAVDAEGNATAAWELDDGSNWIIQSAERAAGGVWSEPVDLSAAGQDAVATKVAVDPEGHATAVWRRFDGANWIIQSAERPAGGVWSEPVDLSAVGQDGMFPQVAVDSEGNATAVWRHFGSSGSLIQSAERPAGGAWSEPVDLSASGQDAGSPQVAVGAKGDVSAIWRGLDGTRSIIQSAERPAGGGWSEPTDLSPLDQETAIPRVAVSSEGTATAVWQRFDGARWIIQSAERSVGGAWSEPVDLSVIGAGGEWPNVAVDPSGNATAVWQHFDGGASIIQSAERSASGIWSDPIDLSAGGQHAATAVVAVDSKGKATAVWRRFNGSNWIIQSTEQVAAEGSSPGDTPGVSTSIAPAAVQTSPPQRSTAFAKPIGRVTRGKALLRLRCRGTGRCRGVIKLIARARVKRVLRRDGHRRTAKRSKAVLIGKARFDIPAGSTETIRVGLNFRGRQMLRHAPRQRLRVRFAGRGVKPRWITLREVPPPRR